MQFGKRIFPYPILNSNEELSEFKEGINFKLHINENHNGDLIKERDIILLKDIYFSVNDPEILVLLNDQKLKCEVIIECPSTVYRHHEEIYQTPKDIKIKLEDLNDAVEVSAFLYVNTDILDFKIKNFGDLYQAYEFTLERYDVIGIDDGYKFIIDQDEILDGKYPSIFMVIKRDISKGKWIEFSIEEKKILIILPTNSYIYYSRLQESLAFKNILLASVIMPGLIFALQFIKEKLQNRDSVAYEELKFDYAWVKAIEYSYKSETGRELTKEVFNNEEPAVLAQIILSDAINKSLEELKEVALFDEE